MKQIRITLSDNQAELLAEKLSALVKECGGSVSITENGSEKHDIFDVSIPIWERIKNVEDAMEYTGMSLPENIDNEPVDVQAFFKLRIICAAYNGLNHETLDEFPKFTEDECRYFPWFLLYTQEEIDKMDDEDKGRVLGRSSYDAFAYAGVACSSASHASSYSYTYNASSHSNPHVGGRLCFKNRELSEECGQRFLKLWAQYQGFIKE